MPTSYSLPGTVVPADAAIGNSRLVTFSMMIGIVVRESVISLWLKPAQLTRRGTITGSVLKSTISVRSAVTRILFAWILSSLERFAVMYTVTLLYSSSIRYISFPFAT